MTTTKTREKVNNMNNEDNGVVSRWGEGLNDWCSLCSNLNHQRAMTGYKWRLGDSESKFQEIVKDLLLMSGFMVFASHKLRCGLIYAQIVRRMSVGVGVE